MRRLGMLAALERLGTVAAVAAEYHLTAPGVSTQLSALEREAGAQLTERRGRRLVLTPAGELLAAHGAAMQEQLSLATFELDAIRRGAVGRYRVAAFPTAARTLIPAAWSALERDGAGLELELTTPEPEGALAALVEGAVDLAIVHDYSNAPRLLPDGVEARRIAVDPVRIAVRDGSTTDDTIELAQLATAAWAVPARDLTCFAMVDRACGLAGFRPRIVAETSDFAVQLQLVAAGAAVALVPMLAAEHAPAGVRLARTTPAVERSIFAVWRRTMHGDAGIERITAAVEAAHQPVR